MDFSDHITMLDFTCACALLLMSTSRFTAEISLIAY